MLVAVVGVVDDTFLKPANLLSLAGDIVPLFIMALGLTFVIYIGGIVAVDGQYGDGGCLALSGEPWAFGGANVRRGGVLFWEWCRAM